MTDLQLRSAFDGRPRLRRGVILSALAVMILLTAAGVRTFITFRPAAITLGPETTLYFQRDPPFRIRVHEAIHRRQMRDKSVVGRVLAALRYNFDYAYRLDEEAEAKAGELCLRIHRFNADLPDYTTARSHFLAETYRAWAWERMGMEVPDRVGETLRFGAACHEILRGVDVDLPVGGTLDDDELVELAALRFLRDHGSSHREVQAWKARLNLVAYAEPAHWDLPGQLPAFGLTEVARDPALPVDTSITPQEAGEALHRLTYYMAERMYVQLRPPLEGYRGRALLDLVEAEERTGVPVEEWPERLLERSLERGLDQEALDWLESMAIHPLHHDFEMFAVAPDADIVGARYRLPFPDEWGRLVLTDLDPVKTAFQAQWGRVALAVAHDRPEEADSVMRIVVSGALQWIRNAPVEVDVLEGLALLDRALSSLEALRKPRGARQPWMEAYDRMEPESWVRGVRGALFSQEPGVVHRAMPALAADPGIPHAFKRFAYRQVLLGDVCLEMRTEPEVRADHDRWRAAVEVNLVRRESDRYVLELMRRQVRDLIRSAEVPPEAVCRPGSGLRPGARLAIIMAPPTDPSARMAEGDEE
jgi:hypothetical protein